jgi:hypothetical protein
MSCPGSVKLCDGLPDETSAYAEAGTQAHDLAARLLTEGSAAGAFADLEDDLAQCVSDYVERVRWAAAGAMLLVEQRVDYSDVIGQPDAGGTADAIIIRDDVIEIRDLKTGMGVKAYAMPQLGLYALGAIDQYAALGPFRRVRLVIDQPRLDHLDEVEMDVGELEAFAAEARAAAAEAMSESPFFQPGDKQCRFCRAKASCPALAAHVQDVIGQDFDNLDAESLKAEPGKIGLNFLANCMAAVPLIEAWCLGIRARVERELLRGEAIDGFKLVQGRAGARRWVDAADEDLKAALEETLGDKAWKSELVSPTAAETLLKAEPDLWEALQDHITRAEGRLSVAPASDKRPAVDPSAVADDFDNLNNTGDDQ